MSVRNLEKLFSPRRVAIIGASGRPGSVGWTVLRNMIGSGFDGVVYPVNPKRESVQGVTAYPRVADVPNVPDLAIVCTPAATVPGVVDACGEAGVKAVLVISAGFAEAGEEGAALQQQLREAGRRHAGLRILGPNCLGLVVPGLGLNATFGNGLPEPGRVAFISQSGALGTAVLDWALSESVGFSAFVSVGNMIDVDFGDLIDHFAGDGRTEALMLYIESITDARRFVSAARAFTRTKPIVAYKGGRFAESAAAVRSHTGRLAGEDAVYEAALERAGIVRVHGMEAMFECAEALARHRPPEGGRLAIVTNAGGPAVIAADQLVEARGTLAELAPETIERLGETLPPFWSGGNPVDVLGDAPAERVASALEITLDDPGVDAALVILAPQAMTDPTATAERVAEVARRRRKTVVAAWVGGPSMAAGVQRLERAGVPTYATPDAAIRAFTALVRVTRHREILHETPREVVRSIDAQTWRERSLFEAVGSAGASVPGAAVVDGDGDVETGADVVVLTEVESKHVLADYGLTVNRTEPAATADEAVAIAEQLGYPVVLKVRSRQILHKTDVGGVALGLHGADAVRRAFDRIVASAQEARPDADVDGVTVQRMIASAKSLELILGARTDPTFGPAIMIGAGGILAELYQDRAVGLPPLNERLARHMLESLRAWPLLTGYRGRPPLDVDAVIEQVIRFSELVADHPEVAEIDVNPLLVTPSEAVALDARILLDERCRGRTLRRYEHLAIRPYPEQYVRRVDLPDGTELVLRPIRPEDEPQWIEMLERCSRETLRERFRATIAGPSHAFAARYCYIDYDREMALVAERTVGTGSGARRELLGVGRLVVGADRDEAEYAVLVVDEWQGRGVGSRLTDECLDIAEEWGVRRVVAETAPRNQRMLAIFERRGFVAELDGGGDSVLTRKQLATAG